MLLCLISCRHLHNPGLPESIPTQGLLFRGREAPETPLWPRTLASHAMPQANTGFGHGQNKQSFRLSLQETTVILLPRFQ